MSVSIPYCGLAPAPGTLLERFDLDPLLAAILPGSVVLHHQHLARCDAGAASRTAARAGRGMAAIAFMSPLYALPVWLFAARIARHMVLMRIAVPLPGLAPPRRPLPFRM